MYTLGQFDPSHCWHPIKDASPEQTRRNFFSSQIALVSYFLHFVKYETWWTNELFSLYKFIYLFIHSKTYRVLQVLESRDTAASIVQASMDENTDTPFHFPDAPEEFHFDASRGRFAARPRRGRSSFADPTILVILSIFFSSSLLQLFRHNYSRELFAGKSRKKSYFF